MTSVPDSIASSVTSNTSTQASVLTDRKRRDDINEKIQELLTIIPPEYFKDYYKLQNSNELGSDPNNNLNVAKTKGTGTKDGKPNKGQILTQTVSYINHLQNQIDANNREEVKLLARVQQLQQSTGANIGAVDLQTTSAAKMLSRIGVGPTTSGKSSSQNNKPSSNKYEYGGYSEYTNEP